MVWRPRLLRGRVQDQTPVVAVVALVALTATTLVGLLAGLLHLAENDAVGSTLGRLGPERLQLEATLWVNGADAGPALDQARTGLGSLTGDLPTTEETWLVGELHALPAEVGSQPHLTYLASFPEPDDLADLVTGTWPDAAVDAQGRVPVAVPTVAARTLGWQVGSTVSARLWGLDTRRTWVVVGTYEQAGPRTAWSRDRLRGAGTSSAFNLPGASGIIRTTAWGPFLVDPAALAGADQVDTAYLVVRPDLAGASQPQVAALRERLRDGGETLADALTGDVGGNLTTDADTTVDAIWRELVVTRTGVVTIGLLLATLATTVMLLTARLLSERRAAENELLAARGASPGQLRSLVVLESLALAAVTCVAAPWLAWWGLGAATRSGVLADAGYRVVGTVPWPVLVACAAMSVVLALTLCGPAWHTVGSTSRSAHAGLLRVGGDLALLVLGGLAMWQLAVYGSPLATGGAGPRLDPVLVAGPAVVVLAAATLALRLVGPVARAAETLAHRARSFVVPLAAWQVSRRSTVSTGTVLVVVVAVAAGTFSAAFAATWRTSQLEQVDLALGTDLRADRIAADPLTASRTFADAVGAHPDAHGQPVTDRPAGVGARGNSGGVTARLIGVDATRPQDLRGRATTSWAQVLAGLPDDERDPAAGTALPDGTRWLDVTGLVDAPGHTVVGEAMVGVTVEDDQGVLTRLEPRTTAIGEPFDLRFEIPQAGPLRLVAVEALLTPSEVLGDIFSAGAFRTIPVRLALTHLATVPWSAGGTDAGPPPDTVPTPVVPTVTGWSGRVQQGDTTAPGDLGTAEGAWVLSGGLGVSTYGVTPARLVASAWPDRGDVPVAVTRSLLDRVDVTGGMLAISVGGTTVDVRVDEVVEHVPGVPRGVGMVADRTTLARAVVQAGGEPELLDSWWVAAPRTTTGALVRDLADADAVLTERATQRHEALTGPVRVAVPAAVVLVAGAAALLVLVGTGAVAAASLRVRRLELARLQALGASRPGLVGGLLAETTLLLVVGAGAGLVAGYGLAAAVAPLLTLSPDGRTPQPAPWLVWGWGTQSLRTLAVVAAACLVVAAVATVGVRRTSGAALRMGDDR